MCSTSIYWVSDSGFLSYFHYHLGGGTQASHSWHGSPEEHHHAPQLAGVVGRWANSYSSWNHSHHLLDTCWEAHHREEEPICVEVLKHPLHRLPVDAEGDAGHSKVKATAHHVIWSQEVLVDGGYGSGYAAWWAKNKKAWGTLEQALAGHPWGREAWRHTGGLDTLLHLKRNLAPPVGGEQWERISWACE